MDRQLVSGGRMIFFDIDGTLIDQRKAEATSASRFLVHFRECIAPPHDVESFCARWRVLRDKHASSWYNGDISYDEYHRRRIRELFLDGAALSDQQCDARFNAFLEEYRAAWTLYDDVLPCLDALQDVSLGIVANGNSVQQRQKLQHTGILHRFAVVVVSDEFRMAKPHRGIFREACRRAGWKRAGCVHVGDRLDVDARGSCAAGMHGIWLNRDHSPGPGDVDVIYSLCEVTSRIDLDAHARARCIEAIEP